MPAVHVRRRVRPLRFVFLVRHGHKADFVNAVAVNTILWGGKFNAIVPVFTRTPRAWRTTRRATEIVRGYLDLFEPDFVVVSDGVDAKRYGVEDHAVVRLAEMLTPEGLAERGLDVMALYRAEYERVFRFVQRRPVRLILPNTADKALGTFVAAVFGAFPGPPLEYFAQGFRDLGGTRPVLTSRNYLSLLRTSITPLLLGSARVEERGASGPRRALILVDPQRCSDLLDYWNLQALGWNVIPVPVDWAVALAPLFRKAIAREHRPDSRLQPWVTRAHVLRGRSVSDAALRAFAKDLSAPPGEVVMQDWLPRLWEAEARDADRVRRVPVSARADEQTVEVRGEYISFETLAPDFAEPTLGVRPRFANVVELRSYDLPELAALIPKDLRDLDGLLRGLMRANMMRASSEGVAVLADAGHSRVTWKVPDGSRVFGHWLAGVGKMRLSGAGRIARQMLGLIGGPDRARLVTNVDIVRLLARANDTASRDIPHEQLLSLLMRLERNSKEVVERRITGMLRSKVMRLGLRLACEHCAQQNWYALDELRETLTCHWCLDTISFPTAMPPRRPCWSYRALGPFSAKGHAHGSYVVAGAIRLLRDYGSMARTTWVPSFTIECASRELEADFGLLWEDSELGGVGPQLVLGECKTFDRFDATDVQRMTALARTFPRAVLIFATFNEQLDANERKLLGRLAVWGRKKWRAPVMVLTARELTSDHPPPYCWQGAADERAAKLFEAVRTAPAPYASLRRLSDATQQLHLDMSPDPDWPHYGRP